MAAAIRLFRAGCKKKPFYRIVATDSRFPREGRFLEILGTYDPFKEAEDAMINEKRVLEWIGKGAQVSGRVKNIFTKKGII